MPAVCDDIHEGDYMKYCKQAAAMAALIAASVAAAPSVQAQTKTVQGWQPPARHEPDPAKRIPPPPAAAAPRAVPAAPVSGMDDAARATAAESGMAAPAAPTYADGAEAEPVQHGYQEGRGGFFLGAKGGRGWVYDDVDQTAVELNAGYRWQAGGVTLIGIELARGELRHTTEDRFEADAVDYGSIGVNARFNFGRTSPVYALVRAGYWAAESDGPDGMDVDGGYFGLGLGVDLNRHVNLGLTYTNYVYFDSYSWGDYYEVNRADTLMLGAEVRF